jgi:threonine synthase
VALAALFKLVDRGQIRPDQRVVVVSTAHGLKFTGFKVGYHEGALADVVARYANPPLELPADRVVVREAIDRAIDLGQLLRDGDEARPSSLATQERMLACATPLPRD